MAQRRLDISLHLDRSEYSASEKAARAESKQAAAALIGDADAVAKAKVEFAKQSNQVAAGERAKETAAAKTAARDVAATQIAEQAKVARSAVSSNATAKRATSELKDEMNHARSATANLGGAMIGLSAGSAILGAASKVADSFQESMKEAAEYTKKVADEFLATQKSMQGIAALTGKQNTDQFTTEQIKSAMAANLKPEEMVQFRNAFLSKASNYVGSAPGAKLNDEESEKLQASMAEYAKLHDVPMLEMADFIGGLLAQEKGPTTAKAVKAKAGKVFATLEASSAKVGHLLPGMTRVMAQGFSPEEAAPLLAQMPEVAPEEESTHLLRLVSEIRRNNLEDKGAKFGMTKGAAPAKQLEEMVRSLSKRKAGGEDIETAIRDFTHEDIAAGTIRGLVNQGPQGIDQWRGILNRTAPDVVDTDIAQGRQSSAGRTMHAEAQLAGEQGLVGARFADATRMKKEAEAALTREGVFDRANTFDDLSRDTLNFFTRGKTPARDQRINERALSMAYDQVGTPKAERLELPVAHSQFQADSMIQKELAKQTAVLEKQLKLQEAAAAPRVPAPIPGKGAAIPGRPP